MITFFFHIFLLLSCAPVFTAEITGYVLDVDTFEGVGGVEIRFYNSTPKGNDDKNYIYQTSSNTDNNAYGSFLQNIIWNDYLPTYWDEGDVIDMYCTFLHPDYEPSTQKIKGIVSGTSNTVASVFLTPIRSSVPSLQGSVFTIDGPVNDVQVALFLKNETTAFARSYTRNINGIDGQYLFENISWIGNDFITGGAKATVRVEDPRYENPIPGFVSQELYHQKSTELLPPMTVEKARPQVYRATIEGTIQMALGGSGAGSIEYQAISGEEIEFSWFYDDENQSEPRKAYAQTDEDGKFTASVEWQDPVQDEDNSVPPNEDQVAVDIVFPSGIAAGYEFDLTSYNDSYTIRSWQDNLLPNAYDVYPTAIAPDRPTSFSATITGTMALAIERSSAIDYQPIIGEEIEFSWFYDDENQSIPRKAYVQSDLNGMFSATIEWEDSVQDSDNSVPFDEDQIAVDIVYPAGSSLGYPFNFTAYNDTYQVRSWQDNTLPAAYEFIIYVEEEE